MRLAYRRRAPGIKYRFASTLRWNQVRFDASRLSVSSRRCFASKVTTFVEVDVGEWGLEIRIAWVRFHPFAAATTVAAATFVMAASIWPAVRRVMPARIGWSAETVG